MKIIPLLTTVLLALHLIASAQVPQHLNYQGRVSVSGVNFTGTGQFKFALVGPEENTSSPATATPTISGGFGDGNGPRVTAITVGNGGSGYLTPPVVTITDNGGTGSGATATAFIDGNGSVTSITVATMGRQYSNNTTVKLDAPPANLLRPTRWSNDNSSSQGSEPGSAVTIPVTNGLYSVKLGDAALGMSALDGGHFSSPVHLRVWFSHDGNSFQQLTPDQPLGTAPYAFSASHAMLANSLANPITSGQLADGAVTSAKIANGAVGAAQLADQIACRGPSIQYLICVRGFFPSAGTPISTNGDLTIGEIRMVAHSLVPTGNDWLPCDGRLIAISQNSALFSLLGTRYGGNGSTNFALPDLRNAAPVGNP